MHHPTDRITHTTAFVTPVVEHWLEREIAQFQGSGAVVFIFIFIYIKTLSRDERPALSVSGLVTGVSEPYLDIDT